MTFRSPRSHLKRRGRNLASILHFTFFEIFGEARSAEPPGGAKRRRRLAGQDPDLPLGGRRGVLTPGGGKKLNVKFTFFLPSKFLVRFFIGKSRFRMKNHIYFVDVLYVFLMLFLRLTGTFDEFGVALKICILRWATKSG